jgi:hypothetical protein
MELKQRERKLDINKLSKEEFDALNTQLGGIVREICDKAVADANKYLNVYGLNAQMQIVIAAPDAKKVPVAQEEPKKKRGRPRKLTQSLT